MEAVSGVHRDDLIRNSRDETLVQSKGLLALSLHELCDWGWPEIDVEMCRRERCNAYRVGMLVRDKDLRLAEVVGEIARQRTLENRS